MPDLYAYDTIYLLIVHLVEIFKGRDMQCKVRRVLRVLFCHSDWSFIDLFFFSLFLTCLSLICGRHDKIYGIFILSGLWITISH